MWIEHPPAHVHPMVPDIGPVPATGEQRLHADTSTTVELYPVRPDNLDDVAEWCRAGRTLVNGGPALLVDGGAGGVAGLGDFVVRTGRLFTAEPGAGIAQRYRLVEG